MDDIVIVSETTVDEIKKTLLYNEAITNITNTVIYAGASKLVRYFFKGHPALTAVDVLMGVIQTNAKLIANQLNFMGENGYTVFVTTATYEFVGYGTGGISYPTYKFKTAEYSYK